MRMAVVMAVAAGSLLGCAGVGGRGARIRQFQSEEVPARCEYLGVVESVERGGWDMSDDQLGDIGAIYRKVGDKGGNAFVLTHPAKVGFGATVRADVYRCP